jgi:hypothetical protein
MFALPTKTENVPMSMYRKNKILLYIGSNAIPLAKARGSENFGSFLI